MMMRSAILAFGFSLIAGAAMAQQTPSDRDPQVLTGRDGSFVTLYGQPGLAGGAYRITLPTGNLASTFRVQSLRVTGGRWEICDRHEYRGQCRVADGRYLTLSDLGLRRIGSMRPID